MISNVVGAWCGRCIDAAYVLYSIGMTLTVITGAIAACCTTISFVPQAFKTIKTKDTTAISASMYSLFTFGSIVWAVYGIMDHNTPVIIANVITAALALIILFYKILELMRTQKNKP